jgi:hypothetical protein
VAMHRNGEVFGEDAKVFRPERLLIADADKLAEMKRVNDLVFGYERWKCLGSAVAGIELGKAIFEVSIPVGSIPVGSIPVGSDMRLMM